MCFIVPGGIFRTANDSLLRHGWANHSRNPKQSFSSSGRQWGSLLGPQTRARSEQYEGARGQVPARLLRRQRLGQGGRPHVHGILHRQGCRVRKQSC